MATVDPTELAKDFRKFYAEVRTKDGNMMSPSGLRGLRAALHRTLTCPPIARDINTLSDREFVLANKMFEAMCRQYVQNANPKPKHHPAIEKGDLNKIAQYINLYKTCLEILLHCFWFLLCYNFARRGGEGWRQLTRQSFQVGIDDQGKQYLYLSHTERNKNWQGGSSSKAWDYSDTRAYGINIEGVHLNIVEVFNFYISKLHPECSALLQKPKYKKWSKAEHSVWFDNVPLGVNKINETMKRISDCAHLSMTYTNHSVRATAITVMYQGGVDTKQICNITKHKTEESLKHYIDGQSAEQKRRCSEVLSLEFQDPKDNNSSTSNNKSLPLPTISSVNNCTTDRPILSQSANTSTQVYNFNGGTCHFHFHYDSAKPAATSDQL